MFIGSPKNESADNGPTIPKVFGSAMTFLS